MILAGALLGILTCGPWPHLKENFTIPFFIQSQRFPWWLRWQRICLQCGRPGLDPWVGKIPWRRNRLPTPVFLGFPGGSAGKESACHAGGPGLGSWVGKIPWRRERLPTPVFRPRELHRLYGPWGHKESAVTEQLSLSLQTRGSETTACRTNPGPSLSIKFY